MSFGCNKCKQTFKTKEDLKVHISKNHQQKGTEQARYDKKQTQFQKKETTGAIKSPCHDNGHSRSKENHNRRPESGRKFSANPKNDKPSGARRSPAVQHIHVKTDDHRSKEHQSPSVSKQNDFDDSGARPKTTEAQKRRPWSASARKDYNGFGDQQNTSRPPSGKGHGARPKTIVNMATPFVKEEIIQSRCDFEESGARPKTTDGQKRKPRPPSARKDYDWSVDQQSTIRSPSEKCHGSTESGARPKTKDMTTPPFENTSCVCEHCGRAFDSLRGKMIHISRTHNQSPNQSNPPERVKIVKEKSQISKDDSEIYSSKSSPSLKDLIKEDKGLVPEALRREVNSMQLDNAIAQEEIRQAAGEMEKFRSAFMNALKDLTPSLKWKSFNSGSYYDKTKNAHADEFDIMIYPEDIQAEVDFSFTAVPGFYKVKITSPRPNEYLKDFIDDEKYIDPRLFKQFVFGLFDRVFKSTEHKELRRIKRKEKTDDSSPAYTVIYNSIPTHPIDIDLVPCFRIDKWPSIARDINPKWIGNDQVVNDAVKCFDVVCKTCPEKVPKSELMWRLSFSYAEKKLITYANDGNTYSSKKKVFRAMKSYIQSIKDKHPNEVKKFCSYHIKQFMLQSFDEWQETSEIVKIQRNVVEKLIAALSLPIPCIDNYFLPGDNVIRFVPKTEIKLIVKCLRTDLKKLHG